MTTHDDDAPRDVVAEARAFVCTSYETLRRHSERMTSGGLTADDKADRQHIMLKALNLLSHLADKYDALRARCETLEGLAGQYFDEDAEGNFYGRDDRETATEE